MMLTSLLDPTSTARKVALGLGAALLVLLLCQTSFWRGYRHGRSTATAEGDAKLAKLEAAQAGANRLASDTARRIVDAEIVRRDNLAAELASARSTIASQGRQITNRRIADASRDVAVADGHCAFGPAWVGLFNEAWGFGLGDPAGAPAAPGAAGEAAGVPSAQAGELPGGVTPEDVQIVNRDNAQLCRDIKAKYLALREWALGLPQSQTTEGP